MTRAKLVFLGLAGLVALAAGGWWLTGATTRVPDAKIGSGEDRAPDVTSLRSVSVAAPSLATRTTAPAPFARPSETVALSSPASTLKTQLALLEEGRDDAFRSTFLPAIRDQITAEAIAGCKRRVVGNTLRPDWEVAEDAVVDGHRVRRVSIFGKSMTGFHEVEANVWLADAVWCLPVVP